jgi:hypothetical protein
MITPRLFTRYGRTVLAVGGVIQALSLASLAATVVAQ